MTTKQDSNELMLAEYKRIIKSKDIPSGGEKNIALLIVDNPEHKFDLLGPVFMSDENVEKEGDLHIYIKDAFNRLPHIKDKLVAAADNPSSVYANDLTFGIASGMLRKDDFSWSSITKAAIMSSGWSNISFGALGEVFGHIRLFRQINAPFNVSNMSEIIINYSYLSDSAIRESEVDKDIIEFFMLSQARMDYNSNSRHKNRMEYLEEKQMIALERINRKFAEYGLDLGKNAGKDDISIDIDKIGMYDKKIGGDN